MKQWTKLHYELFEDPRVKKLIKELAMKGFGTYIILLLLLDCEGTYTKDVLATRAMKYTGKRLAIKVIEGYGLFEEDEDGFLRVSVHASEHASVHASVHASEPFNKKEREENKNKRESLDDARSFFSKPSLSEISEYISTNGLNIDAHRFYSYYESRGWMMGKSPMVDWKAALRSWISSSYDDYDETSYINDAY